MNPADMIMGLTDASSSQKIGGGTELLGTRKLGVSKSAGERFGDLLKRAAQAVHSPSAEGVNAVEQFAQGSEGEIHNTMMKLEKSDISFKFFVTAKNKAIEAYREIMRMG